MSVCMYKKSIHCYHHYDHQKMFAFVVHTICMYMYGKVYVHTFHYLHFNLFNLIYDEILEILI